MACPYAGPTGPTGTSDAIRGACADKTSRRSATLKLGLRETMGGVYERVSGKMVFRLRGDRLDD